MSVSTPAGGVDVLACFNVVEICSTHGGAHAGRLLAEAGLSVLRIETEDSPLLQTLPPFLSDGRSVAWCSANSKKAVVRVDARSNPDLIARMIAASDVFITDDPAWMGHEAKTVTCHIDVYGGLVDAADLPECAMPSTNVLAQARSGAVSVTGRLTGPPVPIGFPVGDVAPGIYATIAILNGLIEGRKQTLEIRAFDAMLSLLSYFATCYRVDGEDIGFVGSGHPYIVPYGAYPASDGWIIVAAFTQVFWRKLCAMFGRTEWIDHPRFRNFSLRRDHRDELNALIADLFRPQSVAHWSEQLRLADVPHAPVYTLHQALTQPVVAARDMVVNVNGLLLLNTPVVDMCRRAARMPDRPALSVDWQTHLRALGIGSDELAGMRASGRIASGAMP